MNGLTNEVESPRNSFRQGEDVVLAKGAYQGTRGVFVSFREDRNWADIEEPNGTVRSHPVVWLAHAVPAIRLTGAIASHQS